MNTQILYNIYSEPTHKHTIHTIEVVQRILDYNIRLKGSDKFFRFLNEIPSAVVLLKKCTFSYINKKIVFRIIE